LLVPASKLWRTLCFIRATSWLLLLAKPMTCFEILSLSPLMPAASAVADLSFSCWLLKRLVTARFYLSVYLALSQFTADWFPRNNACKIHAQNKSQDTNHLRIA
jgi:hypothetical protein